MAATPDKTIPVGGNSTACHGWTVSENGDDRTGSFKVQPPAEKPFEQLRTYINRRSFLSARALNDQGVQASIDTSIEWPINRVLRRVIGPVVLPAGWNFFQLATPPPGMHMMVYDAQIQMVGVNLAEQGATWLQDHNRPAGPDGESLILAWFVPLPYPFLIFQRQVVPIVRGETASGASRIRGVDPVYLNSGKELWMGIESGLGGQNTLIWTQTLTLPDTQSFSAILDL